MIIRRYLIREVFAALIAISVVLLLVFMSNQFVHYIRAAAGGRLTAHVVLLLLALKTPELLAMLLPLSLFLAILLTYGRMYADNEMTVLFASGVSQAKLVRITLGSATVIAVFVGILMFWAAPHVNKYAEKLFNKGALSPLALVQPGSFQSVDKGRWVFYVENVSRDHKKLQNIFAAEQVDDEATGNQKELGILSAQSAHSYLDNKTGDLFLVFNNGNRYTGLAGRKDYKVVSFANYGVRIPQSMEATRHKEGSVLTSDLWHNHSANKAAAELQWRISLPLMAIILALMAVPLCRVKARGNRYAQLVPAILLYIVYGNFMFLGRTWIKDGTVSQLLGLWWVHGLMLVIITLLFLQQSGWRRFFRAIFKL